MKACPTNCGAFAREGHLLCRECWAAVPALLQRAVNATWRAHQAPGIVPGALTSYRRASELARVAAELARGAAKLVVAAAPVPWPWLLLHTGIKRRAADVAGQYVKRLEDQGRTSAPVMASAVAGPR